jgi:hypothetical protein
MVNVVILSFITSLSQLKYKDISINLVLENIKLYNLLISICTYLLLLLMIKLHLCLLNSDFIICLPILKYSNKIFHLVGIL